MHALTPFIDLLHVHFWVDLELGSGCEQVNCAPTVMIASQHSV